MTNSKKIHIALLSLLVFTGSEVFAQKKLEEEIDVVRPYKPVLGDAIKIKKNPDFNDANTVKPTLQYNVTDKQYDQNTNVSKVNPQKLKSEGNPVLPLFYAKLGLGNVSGVLGEAYFNSSQSPTEQYGFFYQTYSAKGDLQNQDLSRNTIGLFGKFISERVTTNASLNFKQDNNYFYGYNNLDTSFSRSSVLHKLNNFNGEVELASNTQADEGAFTYAAKLGGYIFNDNYEARESNILLNTLLGKDFNGTTGNLALNFDFNSYKDSLSTNNNFVRIDPYVIFNREKYTVKAGFNLVSQFGAESKFNFFPSVYGEYHVIQKYLSMFGGFTGDVVKNTIKDFSARNGFLGQQITLLSTREKMKIFGGLKGTIVNGLGFKAQFTTTDADNLPFFVNDPTDTRKFDVVYAGTNSKKSTFLAELSYTASDRVKLDLAGIFNSYDLKGLAQAWYAPKFKLNTSATINATKQLSFTADLFYSGEQFAQTDAATNAFTTLKAYTDLNIGFNYRFYKNFGVFANANNILGNSYDLYLNYPSYGFNFIGGLSVTF